MMSPSAVRILTVIYCSAIAYCNANNVTAYVKEYLTTITCLSVPKIRNVCNIDWKIRQSDAELYDAVIKSINATISSSELYRGLSEGDAMHCRKMYENMMCRNTFPVCDTKRMVIDHGDGKARCEFARNACTTISIEGCDYSTSGVEPIISELNKCENIATNTSKLCPHIQVKVPSRYNVQIVKPIVERLSKIAEMFSEELKNHTVTARCKTKYREVLCRLIDACSPDGFYYLHYINSSECEEMISCVKSAGFSEMITSVCSKIPITEDTESVTVANPYIRPEIVTATATPTTSEKTDHITEKTDHITEKTGRITEKTDHITEKTDHITEKTGIPVSYPTTSTEIATSEILVEPTDENKKPDQGVSNNTIISKEVKKPPPHGNASRNYQNLYIFTMVLILLVGQAVRQFP